MTRFSVNSWSSRQVNGHRGGSTHSPRHSPSMGKHPVLLRLSQRMVGPGVDPPKDCSWLKSSSSSTLFDSGSEVGTHSCWLLKQSAAAAGDRRSRTIPNSRENTTEPNQQHVLAVHVQEFTGQSRLMSNRLFIKKSMTRKEFDALLVYYSNQHKYDSLTRTTSQYTNISWSKSTTFCQHIFLNYTNSISVEFLHYRLNTSIVSISAFLSKMSILIYRFKRTCEKYLHFTQRLKKWGKIFLWYLRKRGRLFYLYHHNFCFFVVVREEMVKEKVIPSLFPDSWLDFLCGNKIDV